MPGGSLLSALTDTNWKQAQPIFRERANNKAVRQGKWKLVSVRQDDWELYDIDADRGETRNLISDFPHIAADLKQRFNQWATRVGIEDWNVIGKGQGFESGFVP